jgi:hypothetical protein
LNKNGGFQDNEFMDLSSTDQEEPGTFEVYANGALIYSRLQEIRTIEDSFSSSARQSAAVDISK